MALSKRPNRFYPSVPGITEDQRTHTNALQQIRESIETHERRNSNYKKSFIRWEELVDLGIIDDDGNFILELGTTGGDSGVQILDDLLDVSINVGLVDDDILGWDDAQQQWVPQSVAELGIATSEEIITLLSELDDINIDGGLQYDLLYLALPEWEPTKGSLQFNGQNLYLPTGGLYFSAVGDPVTGYIDADISEAGNLDLQATQDIYLTPGRETRFDQNSAVFDLTYGIRFVHTDTVKRHHLQLGTELQGGPLATVFDGTSVTANTNNLNLTFYPDGYPIYDFLDEDWTFECWCYWKNTGFNNTLDQTFFGRDWAFSGQRQMYFYWDRSANQFSFRYTTDGINRQSALFGGEPTVDEWHFFQLRREGANLTLWIDGVQSGSTYNIGTQSIFQYNEAPFNYMRLFNKDDALTPLLGKVQELRFTKGFARPTTVPTQAFPRGYADPEWGKVIMLFSGDDNNVQIPEHPLDTDDASLYNNQIAVSAGYSLTGTDRKWTTEYSDPDPTLVGDPGYVTVLDGLYTLVTGNGLEIEGGMSVINTVFLQNDLFVQGRTEFGNDVYITTDLTVQGTTATFNANIDLNGQLDVSSIATIGGLLSANADVHVIDELRVYDAGDTDYISLTHDGKRAIYSAFQTDEVVFTHDTLITLIEPLRITPTAAQIELDFALQGFDYTNGGYQDVIKTVPDLDLAGDEYYGVTAFLGIFEGTDEQTTYTSDDQYAATATFTGVAKLDSAVTPKFNSTTAALFDGANGVITFPKIPQYNLSNQDFTIEYWIYFNANAGTALQVPICHYGSSLAQRQFIVYHMADNQLRFTGYRNGSGLNTTVTTSTLGAWSTGQWYHMAIVRDTANDEMRFYRDGTLLETETFDGSVVLYEDATGNLIVGGTDTLYEVYGLLEGVRMTVGVQRYTGASYTVPSAAFPSTGKPTDVQIGPDTGAGNVRLGTVHIDADATLGPAQDNYVLTYDDATGLFSPESVTGAGGITAVLDDPSPQLGGDLDVQARVINTSTVNGDISIQPNGTGNVILGNYTFDGDQTVDVTTDNYVLTYDHGAGTIGLETITGAGGVSSTNGAADRIAVFDSATNINGDAGFTWTTTELNVGSQLLDLDNSGAATATTIMARNSAGGITLNVNATTARGQIGQISGAGAAEDVWLYFNRNAGVELLYDNVVKAETTAGGFDVTGDITVSGNVDGKDVSTLIADIVEDTTPQLGGNLDVQANVINTSTVNGDISIQPNGTGNVLLGNFEFDADQTVGAGQDNYVLTYDHATTSISLEVVPGGGLTEIVQDTTPQLGGQLDVNGFGLGDGTLELLTFTETGSAVNHINITNAITATGPTIGAAGDDANIDLVLAAKGTGNIALGNFTFDADQAVGAGQDNYVLTYDDALGTIQLEAAAAGGPADGTVTNSTLRWSGSAWVENTDVRTSAGSLILEDRLSPASSTTGFGQYWSYAVNPCRPRWTNDIGSTFNIVLAGNKLSADTYIYSYSNSSTVPPYYSRQQGGGPYFRGFDNGFNTAVDGSTKVELGPSGNILMTGTMKIKERAAANTDTTAYGQIWVKDDVPNTLWFTDDAGTDFQIGGTGGGGIGGSIADNQVAVGAATANDIEGSSALTWDGTDFIIDTDITFAHNAGISDFRSTGSISIETNGTTTAILCTAGAAVDLYQAGVAVAGTRASSIGGFFADNDYNGPAGLERVLTNADKYRGQAQAVYTFNTTTTSGDPGSGVFRINNATVASATEMYIDDLQVDSHDAAWLLSTIAYGDILVCVSDTDQNDIAIFWIDGTPTDNTGWWTIPIDVVYSSSRWSTADRVSIHPHFLSQALGPTQLYVTDDAGRPSAGTAGRIFFNTTDGQLNIDDGTNWTLPDGTTT